MYIKLQGYYFSEHVSRRYKIPYNGYQPYWTPLYLLRSSGRHESETSSILTCNIQAGRRHLHLKRNREEVKLKTVYHKRNIFFRQKNSLPHECWWVFSARLATPQMSPNDQLQKYLTSPVLGVQEGNERKRERKEWEKNIYHILVYFFLFLSISTRRFRYMRLAFEKKRKKQNPV